MILTQCYHGRNRDGVSVYGVEPTFDRFIGLTITEIEKQFGKPKYFDIRRSDKITSPLDYSIRSRMGNDVQLKVYYYKFDYDFMYFWFAQNASKKWIVVGDVTQPADIDF